VDWYGRGCYWQKSGRNDEYFFTEVPTINLNDYNNVMFHMEVIYEDGLCQFFVDDKLIVQAKDLFTFNEMTNCIWGFQSLMGKLWVDNLRIYGQALPQHVDVIKIADIYMESKNQPAAINHLLAILQNYESPDILERALMRLMNIGTKKTRIKTYSDLLASPLYMDRICLEIDRELSLKFLSSALNLLWDGKEKSRIEQCFEKFCSRLNSEEKFRFYVYLGLLFNTYDDYRRRHDYFKTALSIKDDPIVKRYLAKGVTFRGRRGLGRMKYIPGGYLPYKFGCCKQIKPFYMDSTEVTQKMYMETMGRNPSYFKDKTKLPGNDKDMDLARPVEMVTWYDAVLYCNARSKAEGLDTCYTISNKRDTVTFNNNLNDSIDAVLFDVKCDFLKNGYRLPTADEYEYALRAGSTAKFFFGNLNSTAIDYAFIRENSDRKTQPVAQLLPNKFGLYDINGNVWEWCWDIGNTPYSRVRCGACFSDDYLFLNAGYRAYDIAYLCSAGYGLRAVRSVF
jgi:tetratricopeptide (TPR) repeat protein